MSTYRSCAGDSATTASERSKEMMFINRRKPQPAAGTVDMNSLVDIKQELTKMHEYMDHLCVVIEGLEALRVRSVGSGRRSGFASEQATTHVGVSNVQRSSQCFDPNRSVSRRDVFNLTGVSSSRSQATPAR